MSVMGVVRGSESCSGRWRDWVVVRRSLVFRWLGIMWEVWIGVVVGYGSGGRGCGGGMKYILGCGTGGREWGGGIEYIPLENRSRSRRRGGRDRGVKEQRILYSVSFIIR